MQPSLSLACFLSVIRPPGVQFEDALLQILPVDKGKCPFVRDRDDVGFRLYTRHNPTVYQELRVADDEALFASNFDFHDPTVIYFSAFLEQPNDGSGLMVRESYMIKGQTNFIILDIGRLEAGPWYFTAAENTWYIGNFAAKFIDYMVSRGMNLNTTHLIGHSLGGQSAGVAGHAIKSGQVSRITGLDPALPLFSNLPLAQRLDPSDGQFVDIIHTDAGILGYNTPIGHVDFYPNGGISPQPGCELEVVLHEQRLLNKDDVTAPHSFCVYHLTTIKRQNNLVHKLLELLTYINTLNELTESIDTAVNYKDNANIQKVDTSIHFKDTSNDNMPKATLKLATADTSIHFKDTTNEDLQKSATRKDKQSNKDKHLTDNNSKSLLINNLNKINNKDMEHIQNATSNRNHTDESTLPKDEVELKGIEDSIAVETAYIREKRTSKDSSLSNENIASRIKYTENTKALNEGNYESTDGERVFAGTHENEHIEYANNITTTQNDNRTNNVVIDHLTNGIKQSKLHHTNITTFSEVKPIHPAEQHLPNKNKDNEDTKHVSKPTKVVNDKQTQAHKGLISKSVRDKQPKLHITDIIRTVNNIRPILQVADIIKDKRPHATARTDNYNSLKLQVTDIVKTKNDKRPKLLSKATSRTVNDNPPKLHVTDIIKPFNDKKPKLQRHKRFISLFKNNENDNFLFRMLEFLVKNRKSVIPVVTVMREINTLVKSANGELNHISKVRNNYIGAIPTLAPIKYDLELGESGIVAFVKRLLGLTPKGGRLSISET